MLDTTRVLGSVVRKITKTRNRFVKSLGQETAWTFPSETRTTFKQVLCFDAKRMIHYAEWFARAKPPKYVSFPVATIYQNRIFRPTRMASKDQ